MSGLEIDFEARSAINLKTRGLYVYMASPTTQPLMASYRIDKGPIRRWRPGAPCPADIVAFVAGEGMVSAHNAAFERLLWQLVLTPRYGWPTVETRRFRCTAAVAAALGLPRALENLGTALNLDVRKDKAGKALIQKFSVPRRPRKGEPDDIVAFNEPHEFPEDFERFHDYCDGDVLTEAEADSRMVPLSAYEQNVYTLDQIINDRGIRIDRRSALAAARLAEKTKKLLDREMKQVTGGAVGKCSEPAKLLEWVQSRGVDLSTAGKADILDLLAVDDLPADARQALELRQEAAKTSVSKLTAMMNRAAADDRVRHSFIYHKASTGRFQSVGVNFGNMPRPRRVYEDAHLDTGALFEAFRSEEPELLRLLYGPKLGRPLDLISDAIRGFLWAAPGHEYVQADYSSIEGCVIAWSSGEDWKVQALHEIFADDTLPDMYRRTAAGILNLPLDVVTKKHWARQSVGKVSELALGFGGGVPAFYSMSRNYNVDLEPLYAPVWATAGDERREKAARRYENELKRGRSRTDEMSRDAWIACELIKAGWRATNPAIVAGWRAREEAVREAIRNPGQVTKALKFSYVVANGFLWCRLPSGRCLAYASPRLRDQVWAKLRLADGSWSEAEVMDREEAEKLAIVGKVEIQGVTSPSISALGLDKAGRAMQREHLHGGIFAENDTQAIARDILVHGMFAAEGAGYPIVGHVYDEMFAEVPLGYGDLRAFETVISVPPEWAAGLPLKADGWRGKRYRK